MTIVLLNVEYIGCKQVLKKISRYKFLEELRYALVTSHVLKIRHLSNLFRVLKGMLDNFYMKLVLSRPSIHKHKNQAKMKNQITNQ